MEILEQRYRRNADVLGYFYAELEIKENDQKYKRLMGNNDIRKLRNTSEDDFKFMDGTDA